MLYRSVFIDGNEPHRKTRLARVVDAMPKNIRPRIKSLYDHKGMLTVRWFDELYETNLAIKVERLWRNEYEPLVAHVREGDDMNHDTFPYNAFEPHRPIC